MSNKDVHYINLGLIDYQEAWDFQTRLFESIIARKLENRDRTDPLPTPNYFIICQHPHVYTLGRSGKKENLLLSDEQLKNVNANYYEINRGGDITYHGPGQLVGYPILDLDNFFTDIHKYMRFMEETIIRTIGDFGVKGGRLDGFTGVWLDPENATKARKICAMGVKTSRWVTMHGFALNINVDLSYFNNIVPCGITDKAVASLHLENPDVQWEAVEKSLLRHFGEVFECSLKAAAKELLVFKD